MRNGCNGVSFGNPGVPEGDRIPSMKRHRKALLLFLLLLLITTIIIQDIRQIIITVVTKHVRQFLQHERVDYAQPRSFQGQTLRGSVLASVGYSAAT